MYCWQCNRQGGGHVGFQKTGKQLVSHDRNWYTVDCRYNAVEYIYTYIYHDITYNTAITVAEHKFVLQEDAPERTIFNMAAILFRALYSAMPL